MNHHKYIDIAKTIAAFSKDPSTKVGSILINKSDKRLISTGYNGFVAGCNESLMTFERPMKYLLTVHAEINCISFAKQDLSECILYITHSPCVNCLKTILQHGIKTIYYDTLYNKFDATEVEAIKILIKSVDNLIIKNVNNLLNYEQEL